MGKIKGNYGTLISCFQHDACNPSGGENPSIENTQSEGVINILEPTFEFVLGTFDLPVILLKRGVRRFAFFSCSVVCAARVKTRNHHRRYRCAEILPDGAHGCIYGPVFSFSFQLSGVYRFSSTIG